MRRITKLRFIVAIPFGVIDIKELNIVDFLGIIVPGSIVVLLLSGNNADLLLLWTSYFGADAIPLVRGIFLLIAGYLAGMVLHEIGDLAEKGVWCFTPLDPKAYAINAVGITKLNQAVARVNLDTNISANEYCVLPAWIRGILGCFLALSILLSCTLGFPLAMRASVKVTSESPATASTAQHTNTDNLKNALTPTASADSVASQSSVNTSVPTASKSQPEAIEKLVGIGSYIISIAACLIPPVVLGILGSVLYHKNNPRNAGTTNSHNGATQPTPNANQGTATQTTRWNMLQNICLLNPQIQTYLAPKGMPSKMPMFDSFRHVMRNLLIGIAIVNVFSIWHPIDFYEGVASYFIKSQTICHDFSWLTFWFCFVILFAFSRYAHFVYLRYKYSYEAFIRTVDAGDSPEVVHYHVVLEHTPPSQTNP